MRELAAQDPADLVVAWDAVEELLAVVPEGIGKDVLRLTAAGATQQEIAAALGIPIDDVAAHVARGRIRVLTASVELGSALSRGRAGSTG